MNRFLCILVFIVMVFSQVSCKEITQKELVAASIEENLQNTNVTDWQKFAPTSTTNQLVNRDYYLLSYNEKAEQAEWVFYFLDAGKNSGDFKRPYFIQDPKVKTKSADYRNYKNSGYDKGHLVPAGDMKFSKKAFDDTFYTSNISPQRKDFNAGIWNRLEQKTRYWADKFGGIYVVTGGVLEKNLKTIGTEEVAVPKYSIKFYWRLKIMELTEWWRF